MFKCLGCNKGVGPELLRAGGAPIACLYSNLNCLYGNLNLRIACTWRWPIAWHGGEICNIDGVRVDFENGFGLARASNTTPTVILRFEADDTLILEEIQAQFRSQLLSIRADLDLPF